MKTSKVVDALAVAGAALVTYGFWLIAQPAGFIVGGLLLCGASVAGARAEAARGAK